jgi:hypothetical protein
MRIYALSCGSLEFDRSLFFPAAQPGTKLVSPVSSYLIVHPRGKVLFDTGIHCDALADPVGRLGKARGGAVRDPLAGRRGRRQPAGDPRRAPRRYPIRRCFPFHFDHCGCNSSFPRATFLVQRAEMELARAERNRYNPKDWDHPLDYRLIDGRARPVRRRPRGHSSDPGSYRRAPVAVDPAGDDPVRPHLRRGLHQEHLEQTILPGNVHDAAEMTHSLPCCATCATGAESRCSTATIRKQWNSIPTLPDL